MKVTVKTANELNRAIDDYFLLRKEAAALQSQVDTLSKQVRHYDSLSIAQNARLLVQDAQVKDLQVKLQEENKRQRKAATFGRIQLVVLGGLAALFIMK